jgi:hypothetical protein
VEALAAPCRTGPCLVEYLGVRDWSTFASWPAPSGNISTAQYRASVAHELASNRLAWRINTRCLVNGQPATCKRYLGGGLLGHEGDATFQR